jgi:hypothetical protein
MSSSVLIFIILGILPVTFLPNWKYSRMGSGGYTPSTFIGLMRLAHGYTILISPAYRLAEQCRDLPTDRERKGECPAARYRMRRPGLNDRYKLDSKSRPLSPSRLALKGGDSLKYAG